MEKINIIVQFDELKVKPIAFKRNGRLYKNLNLNLVHHFREGQTTIFNFHVSNDQGSFKLRFEPDIMQWFLQETYSE